MARSSKKRARQALTRIVLADVPSMSGLTTSFARGRDGTETISGC